MTQSPCSRQRVIASARDDRAATVSWAVVVTVHLGLLAVAANQSWHLRLEPRALDRTHSEPALERINYVQIAAPDAPSVRHKAESFAEVRQAGAPARAALVEEAFTRTEASVQMSAPSPRTFVDSAPAQNAGSIEQVRAPSSPYAGSGAIGVGRRIDSLGASVRVAIATSNDSITHEDVRKRAASNWTVNVLGGIGVSPLRVHLGLFVVPVPVKVVSLSDFDQHRRARRSILDEVRQQSERAWRDSAVSARIAAIRTRLKEQWQPPP